MCLFYEQNIHVIVVVNMFLFPGLFGLWINYITDIFFSSVNRGIYLVFARAFLAKNYMGCHVWLGSLFIIAAFIEVGPVVSLRTLNICFARSCPCCHSHVHWDATLKFEF